MAYIMDTNEEERAKGKTVEVRSALETFSAPCCAAFEGGGTHYTEPTATLPQVGRAHFETEKRRYTILDAPG